MGAGVYSKLSFLLVHATWLVRLRKFMFFVRRVLLCEKSGHLFYLLFLLHNSNGAFFSFFLRVSSVDIEVRQCINCLCSPYLFTMSKLGAVKE